jgi:transcriptional regulator with XRE-family HTH domain
MPHNPTTSPAPRVISSDHLALGRVVRELRARHAISQEELGFRSRLHRNYIGAIERGEINPTFRTLMTLAHGLDVRLSSLMRMCEARQSRIGSAHPPRAEARGGRCHEGELLRSSCR